MRLAERCAIDRRMVGLMVVHGAAAGNFSPLNVLGALVHSQVTSRGLAMSAGALFFANLGANLVLAGVIFVLFGGLRLRGSATPVEPDEPVEPGFRVDQICTIVAIVGVAVAALVFGLAIGFVAFTAGAVLQLAFPSTSAGVEKRIAWGVVILVCGVVTYVTALQRYGTVTAVGDSIATLGSPLVIALLICAVGAVTSAFASSAGILGAMIPLAAPFMQRGDVGTTGFVIALALSATLVDATPFSTVGALVVANANDKERQHVYRGLLLWGAVMVVVAPLVAWAIWVLPQ
jgi:di/tricarboxylate transporter